MTLGQSAFLGLVQGLTEFLPVSSSGHLVLFQAWMKLPGENVFFDVVLHLGTLLAVLVFFRKEILTLSKDLFQNLKTKTNGRGLQMTMAIIAGTIPTGLMGFFGKDFLESLFHQPRLVCLMLVVTGIIIGSTRFKAAGNKNITLWAAVLIGIAQGFAITPGISRSGMTIALAVLLGINRRDAGLFSFLLSIPAILGAVVLKAGDVDPASISMLPLVVGAVVALASGLGALWVLIRFVNKGKLYYFSPYCFIAGLLGFFLFF